MIHSIEGPGSQRPPTGPRETAHSKKAGAGGPGAAPESAPPAAADRVEISPLARDLSAVRAHLGDRDAARAERVNALKAAVGKGVYRVNAETLARKIADSAR